MLRIVLSGIVLSFMLLSKVHNYFTYLPSYMGLGCQAEGKSSHAKLLTPVKAFTEKTSNFQGWEAGIFQHTRMHYKNIFGCEPNN